MKQNINWHYIKDEGLPKVKGDRPRLFLICVHQELGEKVTFGRFTELIPTGKFIDYCTIALIQEKDSKEGSAYSPAKKFYWGSDIFDNAYAWAEMPDATPYIE